MKRHNFPSEGPLETKFCPKCHKQGLESEVLTGLSESTAAYCPVFYDEEGKMHSHDRNIHKTKYSCSNGHRWTEKVSGICWCGWGEDKPVIIEEE